MICCKIDGCARQPYTKKTGLCKKHYYAQPIWKDRSKAYNAKFRESDRRKSYLSDYKCLNSYRYYHLCSRAKKHNRVVELTAKQHDRLTGKPCIYCGEFTKGQKFTGIDRIDSSIGYTKSNSYPCCSDHNYMKGEMSVVEFLDSIDKVYKYVGNGGTKIFEKWRNVGGSNVEVRNRRKKTSDTQSAQSTKI